jgi:tricorn protease
MRSRSFALGVALLVSTFARADEARLLRFPTIHGDRVAFTYAGNLYTAPSSGGVARRLTNDDGNEVFARYSPDGKWIAFTGMYDGNTEVYVMPAEGGVPRRLTWTATLGRDELSDRMGPNNIVMGWKHDSKHIVFRSRMHSFNDFLGQLYLVSIDGGLPQELPLPRGGFASFSPDDSKLAYNRVFREFRTWKRYRGGMADDIWIHDFASKKTDPLFSTSDQEIIPMWHADTIYFLADRDNLRRMNLYSCDLKSKEVKRLTDYTEFDIKFASLGDKAIVYENGGWLYRYDLADGKPTKINVQINDDRSTGRGGLRDISKSITNFGVSPDGKRALFGTRGEIFTVPAKDGPTRNLTRTSGAHERDSDWSPDGKWISYISDATGEDEIYIVPQDGRGPAQQITTGGDCYKFTPVWSPDSKKLMWADRKQRLLVVDVASKQVKEFAQSPILEFRNYVWSPDSKWIAFQRTMEVGMPRVLLYSVEQGTTTSVTDGEFSSGQPCFSGDGKYLFLTSSRDFNPILSQTEFNHAYVDMSRIFFVTLAKDTPSPFKPKSDEALGGELTKPEEKKEKEKEAPPIKVDLDGIAGRVLGLPIAASNYGNLRSVGSTIYYGRRNFRDPPSMHMFDLTANKETSLGNVGAFDIPVNGKKMIVSQSGKYGIIDLPKATINISEPLNLSNLEVILDRKAEWKQIFHECWRQMRDFFYDPNMHGLDWKAVRDRYAPLVDHVVHRADLSYIIGEMIGELNVGHAYVGGGDLPAPQRVPLGLLGAKLVQDPNTKAVRIARIWPGDNWDKRYRSPLTEIGVNVKEGEYLLAINGRPVAEMASPYEALVNTVDRQVVLTVNGEPKMEGSREITVVPIADESNVIYRDWVETNRKKVEQATGGKVGYIHVPDMLTPGLNEFTRQFWPQLRKKALIVDVRGNGGGNISPMLVERLRREAVMIGISRNGMPLPDPQDMLRGPMVCLMNEFSASDGDLFPFRFKQYKLGPLIGKRSWGGVVGIRGTLPLLDGGTLNRPEFSRYDLDGTKWIIEGHGVDPDVVVDNDPAKEFAGTDQQLDKGIEMILETLKTTEKTIPPPPPPPKKNP